MPTLLEQIVRDLLEGEGGIQVDEGVTSLRILSKCVPHQSTIVVIEADPPEFAHACDVLPDVRLVGIARDGRHVTVRFCELSRERLRDAIRCVACERVV